MNGFLLLVHFGFFVAALIFSITINGLLLKFAKTLGIRNNQETIIRWSSTSKPALGGISFYIIFLFSLIALSFFKIEPTGFFNLQTMGLLAAASLGFLIGLYDDAYNTHPRLKLAGQLMCGLLLIFSGTYIQFFGNEWLNYLLTMFWVVGIMNSINMLDNMDGITTIVSIGILLTILGIIMLTEDLTNPVITILIGGLASLIGFLYYNWNPSKMYMGDTGSQFLGIFLAGLGIIYFWNGAGFEGEVNRLARVITVAMAFALPLIDTTTVFYKRISKGGSPFVGGKDHTTHHLSYLGLNDRKVAIFFLVFSLISVALTIWITTLYKAWKPSYSYIFIAYLCALFLFLLAVSLRPAPDNPKN
jgi:UDP-GlcNAc:undecaprenyl-phosphate/decaprenyl-phosphate GlcNAc-1-phosphate transferase